MAPIVGQRPRALNRPRGALLILSSEAGLRAHDEPAILVIGSSGELIHSGSLSLASSDRVQGPAKEIVERLEIGQFDSFLFRDLNALGHADEVEGHARLPDRVSLVKLTRITKAVRFASAYVRTVSSPVEKPRTVVPAGLRRD